MPLNEVLANVGRELQDLQTRSLELEKQVFELVDVNIDQNDESIHMKLQNFDQIIQSLQALSQYLLVLEDQIPPDQLTDVTQALKKVHLGAMSIRLTDIQDNNKSDFRVVPFQNIELF